MRTIAVSSVVGQLTWLTLAGAGTAAATSSAARVPVTIERRPQSESIRRLDPSHPPGDWPGGDDRGGMTACSFASGPFFNVRRDFLMESEQGCSVRVRVIGADVILGLQVTTWIPFDAPVRLEEHEQGHRDICARVYEHATDAAREAARGLIGRGFEGSGATCAEALERAVQDGPRAEFLRRLEYLTTDVARRANAHYDRVTENGASTFPPARIALAGALEVCAVEQRRRSPADLRGPGTVPALSVESVIAAGGDGALFREHRLAWLRHPPGPQP